MTSISAVASGPSYFSQGEDSLPPHHQSVEELVNWVASEIYSFLDTNNVRATMAVPTPAGNSKGPEPAHANGHWHQSHHGVLTTSATAIIPFSGRSVPTWVTLSLQVVPLHLPGTGQYPPSLNISSPPSLDSDRDGEISPFPPSQQSEPSHLSADYAMTGSDTTNGPRYVPVEYPPTQGGFPIAPRILIPRPDERHDHRPPPGHDYPTQESIADGTPAALRFTASPGVAVYPPPFNPTPYLVSGHPLSSPQLNHGVIPPACTGTPHQNEGNGPSTSQVGQTYQGTPTLLTTAGPVQHAGVEQHQGRHKCTMCRASYARPSELNRHVKDKHTAWVACDNCKAEFSSGRMYRFTQHLQTCPGA